MTTNPSSAVTSSGRSGQELPAYGAPGVQNPLEASKLRKQPCLALSDPQVKKLLGDDTNRRPRPDDAEGPACAWSDQSHDGSVKVSFITLTDSGLSAVYKARGDEYDFFEELPPVSGYPSVAFGHKDTRSVGRCTIAVGTSDHDTFGVSIHLSEQNVGKKDPCEVAHLVAGMVVENIKGVQ